MANRRDSGGDEGEWLEQRPPADDSTPLLSGRSEAALYYHR